MAGTPRSLRVVPATDSFAALLATARRENAQTQADVARLVGVRQQTIAAWESGDRPQARFYSALVDYLKLDDEAALRKLLLLEPVPQTQPQFVEPTKSAQAMHDSVAESFAARTKLGPLSNEEAALFRELLAHYRARASRESG